MLYQIVSFVLDVVIALFAGACLMRLYMQQQRVPFNNQVGQLVFALTDWIVLPLRKVVRPVGKWDLASLVAAYVLVLAKLVVLWALLGGVTRVAYLPVIALFGLAQLVISVLTALLIVYAVLSWVQPGSPLAHIADRLCAPLLRPLRSAIPLVGGFDFSPLVALLVLQIIGMLLGGLQGEALRLIR